MNNERKTYSGEQSYHEMLRRAQSLCPSLLYVLCKLLLPVKIAGTGMLVRSEMVRVWQDAGPDEIFSVHFYDKKELSRIDRFIESVFDNHTVAIGWEDDRGREKYLKADVQFVCWLQKNVVTVDDEKMLVTIHS